jgi:elongation factor Ts
MADISAQVVKDLRDKTGAGMMDCKKALAASNGNLELAIEHLRKSGLAKMDGRSGKATNEGKVVYVLTPTVAVLAEVLCETDFAAKSDKFLAYAKSVAERTAKELTAVGDVTAAVTEREQGSLGDLVSNIGENVQIRRVSRWVPQGKLAVYIHGGGKIGVLADVAGEVTDEQLNNLCMHIAAFKPRYLDPSAIPAAVLAKEREIAAAMPDMANKPANIVEKILDGKMQKWYTEICLVKQPWLLDDKQSVEKANPKARILRFLRWQVGEAL